MKNITNCESVVEIKRNAVGKVLQDKGFGFKTDLSMYLDGSIIESPNSPMLYVQDPRVKGTVQINVLTQTVWITQYIDIADCFAGNPEALMQAANDKVFDNGQRTVTIKNEQIEVVSHIGYRDFVHDYDAIINAHNNLNVERVKHYSNRH